MATGTQTLPIKFSQAVIGFWLHNVMAIACYLSLYRSVCVCVCVEFREIVSKIQINNQMIHDERGQSNWLTWLFAFRTLRMRQKNNMHKICAVVRKFRCELLICIKWEIRIETKWKDGNIFPLSYHNHQSLWTSDSNICTIFHSLKYGNFICWIWWRWVYAGESPVLFSTDFFPVGIYSKKMNIPEIFAAASKWSNTNRAIGGMNESIGLISQTFQFHISSTFSRCILYKMLPIRVNLVVSTTCSNFLPWYTQYNVKLNE